MLEFKYLQTTNTKQYSRNRRSTCSIKYIVIHDTGNYSKTAGAMGHYRYLNNASRPGSAHFYVDDKLAIQTVGDTMVAWAVGDNQGHGKALNGVTNSNSISIELCVNGASNYDKAYYNVVELTKNLMKKFNIPPANVCRHFDVSRKTCPNSMKANNWAKWWEFKELIKQPIELIIDTDKDSIARPANKVEDEKDKEVIEVDYSNHWANKHWDSINELVPDIMTDKRFNDPLTRGEMAKIIDCLLNYIKKQSK